MYNKFLNNTKWLYRNYIFIVISNKKYKHIGNKKHSYNYACCIVKTMPHCKNAM